MYKEFPTELKDFLRENDISESEYSYEIPRYVRFSPNVDIRKLDLKITKTWFPGFYSIPSNTKISNVSEFKNGLMFGMDLASGIAIHALSISHTDHVLDICCAPGTKLRLISDTLGLGLGSVTGVDCSKHRLYTTKAVLKKHSGDRIRLFLADGCSFAVPPVSRIGSEIIDSEAVFIRKRKLFDDDSKGTTVESELTVTPLKPFYATKLLRHDTQTSTRLYDKVIVDAECTHDGSVFHLEKYLNTTTGHATWSDFLAQLTTEKLLALKELQRGLIENGYRMVKKGGILVYSTCSFTTTQNEEILAWLLNKYPEAMIEAIPDVETMPIAPRPPKAMEVCKVLQDRGILHSVRFTPVASKTSGLFVARIRKPS